MIETMMSSQNLKVKNVDHLLLSKKQQKVVKMLKSQSLLSGTKILDSETVFTARGTDGEPLFAKWDFRSNLLEFDKASCVEDLLCEGKYYVTEHNLLKRGNRSKWLSNKGCWYFGEFYPNIDFLQNGKFKRLKVAYPPAVPRLALDEAKKNALLLLDRGVKFHHYELVGDVIWEERPHDPVIVGVIETTTTFDMRVILSEYDLTQKEVEFLC